MVVCSTIEVLAQDNPYKAPLYWDSYEYQYTHNDYLPQDVWKEQANWVEKNFKSYGYDMIVADGWIEGSSQTNANGYVLKHHNSWIMTWKDMGEYLKAKGLKFGVYYNPMWVTPAAVADTSKTVIGTNIKICDIVDTTYHFSNARGLKGDRFGYNGGDHTLYWVDVTKPGAEEFVKGYIDYFASCGVSFLRVDFLSWYEDGIDKGTLVGRPDRPEAHYELQLKWMKEACDKHHIFLSLVMPHLKDDGRVEKKYGNMIRINEDIATEGWKRFSELYRGVKRQWWSVYANPCDGFIYWSRLSGRGKMILDGDFTRMNTFGNDEEKKSAVSWQLMAGGPVAISDLSSSIGDNARFYQNSELLELNKDGFVGKPLSGDPANPSSQIWKGQLSNGDWVVGLFNREDSLQTRNIDFMAQLGLKSATVRDMWLHVDLGRMSSISKSIPAHGCVILRIEGK
ncbi:MAG: DUF5116 domain-containing protein [Bacteroidia bacterium]|nr:DUF5116 domain-containing protein [Bacteroidia bacterium]